MILDSREVPHDMSDRTYNGYHNFSAGKTYYSCPKQFHDYNDVYFCISFFNYDSTRGAEHSQREDKVAPSLVIGVMASLELKT